MARRLFLLLAFTGLAAGHAVAQERQWSLDAGGEDAYLVFGVPDTEDIGVSIWCPVQQGEVRVYLPEVPAGLQDSKKTETVMTISTDEASADVTAVVDLGLESGLPSVEATLPVDHPVLASMLNADRFRVTVKGEETVFPLFDADLSGLMELCRTP
jgi:hypothetical protein